MRLIKLIFWRFYDGANCIGALRTKPGALVSIDCDEVIKAITWKKSWLTLLLWWYIAGGSWRYYRPTVQKGFQSLIEQKDRPVECSRITFVHENANDWVYNTKSFQKWLKCRLNCQDAGKTEPVLYIGICAYPESAREISLKGFYRTGSEWDNF